MTTIPTGRPAWARRAGIGDYGGASDKADSSTEGTTPYAFLWYQELQAGRGSAYSTDPNALVSVENFAVARSLAWAWSRLPEATVNNSTPVKADDLLDYWASVLRVRVGNSEPRYVTRIKAASKYRISQSNNLVAIEAAVSELMGDWFNSLLLTEGSDLENPPAGTFWPTINPGPASYDLGAGAWLSSRNHLTVYLNDPDNNTRAAFLQAANVDLVDLLDGLLPAEWTFGWSTTGGFLLDISQLGYDGL